jgi:hypothetical protein
VRAPNTELAYTTHDDSDQARTVPGGGMLPTSGR